MGKNEIHIMNNKGQVFTNDGGGSIHNMQNVYNNGRKDQLQELVKQLDQLIHALEQTDELDDEGKEEYLTDLHGAKSRMDQGKATPKTLERINNRLIELSGVVQGSAALGQMVSATMIIMKTLFGK